jgi:hypothetical protein
VKRTESEVKICINEKGRRGVVEVGERSKKHWEETRRKPKEN